MDTNLLVYAVAAAQALHTSTQVLQKLFVTLTRKVPCWATRPSEQRTNSPSGKSLPLWYALIVVAAARSGSKRLYTEDLRDGQTIVGVEVLNPFRSGRALDR